MKNIHVRRFVTPNTSVQGLIEPEDKSWLVLIDDRGEATFWRQCPANPFEPHETGEPQREFYIDAELPGGRLRVDPVVEREPPAEGAPRSLDFTVEPTETSTLGPPPVDEGAASQVGYWARLNARQVACFGETEHLAVKNLLNYVAQLCTAGSLDHTGRPMPGHSRRRYEAVFGPSTDTQ